MIKNKTSLKKRIKRWLKKLLAPIMREVIEDREKEIIDTTLQVAARRHRTAL